MTKLFASLAVAILGLVAVAAQPAAAEDETVGQVSRSDGAPQVQRADALLAATPGLPVLVDDLLITDARSRLEVTLADRSVVVIGPASQVRVVNLELAAEYLRQQQPDKPIVAYIAGRHAPAGRRMGHAGAIISGGRGDVAGKVSALRQAGVHIAESPTQIGQTMLEALR